MESFFLSDGLLLLLLLKVVLLKQLVVNLLSYEVDEVDISSSVVLAASNALVSSDEAEIDEFRSVLTTSSERCCPKVIVGAE